MTDEEFEQMKEWGLTKRDALDHYLREWAEEYKGLSKESLHERLSRQDTDTLKWIVDDVDLPAEHYELCQMAKVILSERGESL